MATAKRNAPASIGKVAVIAGGAAIAVVVGTLRRIRAAEGREPAFTRTVEAAAGDITASDGWGICRALPQHGDTSVAGHSLNVCRLALAWAGALRIPVDTVALVRGSLLHDYFLYDWHDRSSSRPRHATMHPRYAYENAGRDFGLGAAEADIVLNHMFPLAGTLPATTEGRLVCAADKACAVLEFLRLVPEQRA